jgi:hypothetical protein
MDDLPSQHQAATLVRLSLLFSLSRQNKACRNSISRSWNVKGERSAVAITSESADNTSQLIWESPQCFVLHTGSVTVVYLSQNISELR